MENTPLTPFHQLSPFPLVAVIVGTCESPGRESAVLSTTSVASQAPNEEITHLQSAAQQSKPILPYTFLRCIVMNQIVC